MQTFRVGRIDSRQILREAARDVERIVPDFPFQEPRDHLAVDVADHEDRQDRDGQDDPVQAKRNRSGSKIAAQSVRHRRTESDYNSVLVEWQPRSYHRVCLRSGNILI